MKIVRSKSKCTMILAVFIFAASSARAAMELVVLEKARFSDPEPIRVFSIEDILGKDSKGKARLNIFPNKNPQHQDLVSLLSAGMPFDAANVRSEIASILETFPEQCRENILVGLSVSPIEDIDTYVPNVKDKRRVSVVSVEDCLAQQPAECMYTVRDNGAFDFDLGKLKRVLTNCSLALSKEIQNGAELADFQAKNNPNQKVSYPTGSRHPQSVKKK